jgi:hypothetical protein
MTTSKQLSRRQLAVMEELFAGELDEQMVLDKYKVGRKLYNRWLAEPAFAEQIERCVAAAYRQSALLVARNAPSAAKKLVELAGSGKGETARKACLDIISMQNSPPTGGERRGAKDEKRGTKEDGRRTGDDLSPETATRLLAVLAEETKPSLPCDYLTF